MIYDYRIGERSIDLAQVAEEMRGEGLWPDEILDQFIDCCDSHGLNVSIYDLLDLAERQKYNSDGSILPTQLEIPKNTSL